MLNICFSGACKMMYSKQFWKVVKLVNWDGQCKEDKIEDLHEDLKDFCLQEGISLDKFQDYLHKFETKLWNLIADKNLNQWKYKRDFISDDGMSDCISHIIGLGKEEYEKCLSNPDEIMKRYDSQNFVEKFSYITHELH
jgi:hypothetical protein